MNARPWTIDHGRVQPVYRLETMMNATKTCSRWDVVGISASLVCLIHCLGLPYLLGVLPALASTLPGSEVTHQLLAASVVIPAALVALPSYRTHRCLAPFLLICIGIQFVINGVMGVVKSA